MQQSLRARRGTIDTLVCRCRNLPARQWVFPPRDRRTFKETPMHGIIYLIGLIVVIMFLLSLLGLR